MIIWLASYPKSGNTFVRAFLSSYYYSKEGEFDFSLFENIKQFPNEEFFEKKLSNIEQASQEWIKAQKKSIAERKSAIIVEGYTDVIGLYQFGVGNSLATLGTATTENHINKVFRIYC